DRGPASADHYHFIDFHYKTSRISFLNARQKAAIQEHNAYHVRMTEGTGSAASGRNCQIINSRLFMSRLR
ncbi:MAG TPA: hypothetical protein P5346_05760, partial [Spirochaetota bacterium]|nr:hypothetical protein [Spirochaetota bacterium]